jgi:hypothetical protein
MEHFLIRYIIRGIDMNAEDIDLLGESHSFGADSAVCVIRAATHKQ